MARLASTRAAFIGLPASSEIVRATSSWRRPRWPATRTRISARLCAGSGSRIASSAASIARRVSSAPAFATRPTVSPEYGEATSIQSPVSIHSPPISSLRSRAVTAMRASLDRRDLLAARAWPRREAARSSRRSCANPDTGVVETAVRPSRRPRDPLRVRLAGDLRRRRNRRGARARPVPQPLGLELPDSVGDGRHRPEPRAAGRNGRHLPAEPLAAFAYPSHRGAVRVCTEADRGRREVGSRAVEIRRVGVVGLGTMGAGIAQVSVQAGFETVGREVSDELGERGKATIDRYLSRGVEKGRLTREAKDRAIGRLTLTTELADLADCDLVIEAVLEELPLKREVFAELDRVTRPEAILATNTSALSVAEIAEATERPERVVGMHFFNPATVLPLVEIVRAPKSSDDAVRAAYDWAEGAGKQPVTCNDTPGFIVNRILIPLLNDCVRVLDEAGVAPEDLDKAMTNGAGWPLGPCALVDLVGIDVHIHASEALYDKLGEERMAPPERLLRLQREGRLRRQTRPRFFGYE